jgi:cytochrome c biogenesis protein CcdA
MLLGFGTTSVERRETGKYFVSGRFIGVIIIGLIIAMIGLVFVDFFDYLMILFGILTITFGLLIFYKLYEKYKVKVSNPVNPTCGSLNLDECAAAHACSESTSNPDNGNTCTSCESNTCKLGNNEHVCKTLPRSKHGSKLTKRYSFFLGLFRGATPCLKLFVIAPLLIVVDFYVAVLMVLVFAATSTIYTIIGFISASILTSFRKYETHVQIAGATILIAIGLYTIIIRLITPACTVGL